ncbi:extensin family protein [Methylopila musalis]|uniref:Extensin family protein n=1 Tax=Methylopila musalis TaxID=1134781 RepID=A0ABW3Z6A9_9HYPH
MDAAPPDPAPPPDPPPSPPWRPVAGRLLLTALAGLAVVAGVVAALIAAEPERRLAFDLNATPDAFTGLRLRLLTLSPGVCAETLRLSGLSPAPAAPRPLSEGCGYDDGVTLRGLALAPAPVMRCPMAASYALFERHVLQPAAERRFGARAVAVGHFGTYACRNVYHRAAGRRSQHATANALDIASVRLSTGRVITVAGQWDDGGAAGLFLRDLRAGACGLFGTVLSPDYNAAHADHFHMDRGMARICR